MKHSVFKSPAGEDLVVMSLADFEAIQDTLDAARHTTAMGAVAAGALETLTQAEIEAALAAPTPLAFWREKRGLTQKMLADAIGISQPYLASLEKGIRNGNPGHFRRLADVLKVRMEDLIDG